MFFFISFMLARSEVLTKLGKRKANMTSLNPMPDGTVRLEFEIPARGLIGFRNEFLTDTKGEGIMNHSHLEYRPYTGTVISRIFGALFSMDDGEAVAFSIFNLQSRGIMFISAQDKVYSGMVIGESARPGDLDVNPLKGKALTNMRTSGTDEAVKLITPRLIFCRVGFQPTTYSNIQKYFKISIKGGLETHPTAKCY
jgi:GTP-binding protein